MDKTKSNVSHIDLPVLNQLVLNKGVKFIFEHTCCYQVKHTCGLNCWKKHIYNKVQQGLVNKLDNLIIFRFSSAASFEDVITIATLHQHTYDTFVATTKTYNKAVSLN